jgi:hypothetical protein
MLKGLVLTTLLAAACVPALAGEENFDIDTRFRAKIAKEKVRQSALERAAEQRAGRVPGEGDEGASCGSQSIGNIDTGGRPGRAPREVFIFAPNAINMVSAGGCR